MPGACSRPLGTIELMNTSRYAATPFRDDTIAPNQMPNRDHLAVLMQGVVAWNQWRKAHPRILPDLRKADLRLAVLDEIIFDDANLYRANLAGAVLQKSTFRGAVLGGADLTNANLSYSCLAGAHLGRAILDGAKMIGSELRGTDLYSAEIGNADLTGAIVAWTVLGMSI